MHVYHRLYLVQVSNMLPSIYSEQYVRVYSREEEHVKEAYKRFKQFCEKAGYMPLKVLVAQL